MRRLVRGPAVYALTFTYAVSVLVISLADAGVVTSTAAVALLGFSTLVAVLLTTNAESLLVADRVSRISDRLSDVLASLGAVNDDVSANSAGISHVSTLLKKHDVLQARVELLTSVLIQAHLPVPPE